MPEARAPLSECLLQDSPAEEPVSTRYCSSSPSPANDGDETSRALGGPFDDPHNRRVPGSKDDEDLVEEKVEGAFRDLEKSKDRLRAQAAGVVKSRLRASDGGVLAFSAHRVPRIVAVLHESSSFASRVLLFAAVRP